MGLKCIMMAGQFFLSLSSSFVCLYLQTNKCYCYYSKKKISIQNRYDQGQLIAD